MSNPSDWYAVFKEWQRARDDLSAVVASMQWPSPTPQSLERYSRAYAREQAKRLRMQAVCTQMRAAGTERVCL